MVTVQRGETVYALSRRYGTPVRSIIETNNLRAPFHLNAGQKIRLRDGQYHTVQTGETLYSISRAYRTDVYSLARTNNLKSPYTLSVGQALKLPVSRAQVASAAKPAAPKVTTVAKAKTAPDKNIHPQTSSTGQQPFFMAASG